MKGSKYADETRERVLALIASGKTVTAAAREAGVPKSTAAHWWNTQYQDDEDAVAARMEARRASIRKCGRIVDRALGAIDRKVCAAAHESKAVTDGMAVLRKAARDGVIALSEDDVKALGTIVRDYTGVGLRELSATMGDVCKMQQTLETQLTGGGTAAVVQVTFDTGEEAFAG